MANQNDENKGADGPTAAAELLAEELRRTTATNIEHTERLEHEARARTDDRFAIQLALQERSVAASELLAASMARIANALELEG